MTTFQIVLLVVVLVVAAAAALLAIRGRRTITGTQPPAVTAPAAPSGAVAPEPGPESEVRPAAVPAPPSGVEAPEAPASRMVRLRRRLAGSENGLARALAGLLSTQKLDADV